MKYAVDFPKNCQKKGCRRKAVQRAAHGDDVGVYCQEHAESVADYGEYMVRCVVRYPHCDCLFGV